MKKYERPVVIATCDLAEGVYAASGGSDCYTATYNMHQKPQEGRGDYRIQVNASHAAGDQHHSGEQVLVISFNQPVVYSGSNGTLVSGDGTNTLQIRYNYHNNAVDNIGLGDVIVNADQGLGVTGCYLTCNFDCGQH